MCRFVAYIGTRVPLEEVVVLPRHSLIDQSQNAEEAKLAVNGDGFGVAWYDGTPTPGLYRDVLPAWADDNLVDLCRMIRSTLFLAHVRASTVGEVARINCHPFRHDRWSFMHNGQIADFSRIRRQLEGLLPDSLYDKRRGGTDSELLFLLLLAQGLQDDPQAAVLSAVRTITEFQGQTRRPNRLTCAMSDGSRIFAFRHSSDAQSPTLYLRRGDAGGGTVLASERLDDKPDWIALPENSFVEIGPDGARIEPLALTDDTADVALAG